MQQGQCPVSYWYADIVYNNTDVQEPDGPSVCWGTVLPVYYFPLLLYNDRTTALLI